MASLNGMVVLGTPGRRRRAKVKPSRISRVP